MANPPKDLHISPEESQRAVARYLISEAQRTGQNPKAIRDRMSSVHGGPNLLEYLGQVRVVRQRYASLVEYQPTQTTATDRADRLRGIPVETVEIIDRGGVVEGDAVHSIRQWQALSGGRARGLLLLGAAGAGKTLHASLLLRGDVFDVAPEGWFIGESLLTMHLGSGTKSDKQDALAPMQSTPLLVVDYMGQRKAMHSWEAAVLEFLRLRWESGKRCVLTFRGELDAFKQCYGADGWATVERFCTVVKVRRGS